MRRAPQREPIFDAVRLKPRYERESGTQETIIRRSDAHNKVSSRLVQSPEAGSVALRSASRKDTLGTRTLLECYVANCMRSVFLALSNECFCRTTAVYRPAVKYTYDVTCILITYIEGIPSTTMGGEVVAEEWDDFMRVCKCRCWEREEQSQNNASSSHCLLRGVSSSDIKPTSIADVNGGYPDYSMG